MLLQQNLLEFSFSSPQIHVYAQNPAKKFHLDIILCTRAYFLKPLYFPRTLGMQNIKIPEGPKYEMEWQRNNNP